MHRLTARKVCYTCGWRRFDTWADELLRVGHGPFSAFPMHSNVRRGSRENWAA